MIDISVIRSEQLEQKSLGGKLIVRVKNLNI